MFGGWQAAKPGKEDSETPGQQQHKPSTSRNRFLKSLYNRAKNANAPEKEAARHPLSTENNDIGSSSGTNGDTGDASSVLSHASSTNESYSRSTRTNYSMLGSIHRSEPQPTVELARPAPEVEFSRVADAVYPVLNPYVSPVSSVSLLSLRASQQQGRPDLIATPSILSSSSRAGSSLATGTGMGNMSGYFSGRSGNPLSGAGLNSSGIDDSMHGANALQTSLFGFVPAHMQPFSHFDDERNVPFRANAVEIAAQDDKHECAFLPNDHGLPGSGGAGGNDYMRQSILNQLLDQLHPTKTFNTIALNANSDREDQGKLQPTIAVSSHIYNELSSITDFNQQARVRVDDIKIGKVMAQFPLQHVQVIIRQLLDEIEVSENRGWDDMVLRLVANAVARVRPNVHGGDKMDLRNYVRIKRIPGASPQDSQYVEGLVFTRNLAHRRMPRFLKSPRIMLLTLPLEYSDNTQTQGSRYVSFDGELRMQQGFTEKLIQRISSAAPDLVFTEKLAPRHVLEGLMRNNIAVAHGIKRSVIRAIARCTGADVVTSMSKFSDYPRIGTCRSLVVQTYEDSSFPEFRKSFIFLDGCNEELGGTIVLRGESFTKLGEIKQIVDLVVCLTYSMFLETALLSNEYVLAAPGKYELSWSDTAGAMVKASAETTKPEDESLALEALNEYNIVLSSSPCVHIPPPHVLVCMREKELAIRAITEKFNKMSTARKESALPTPADLFGGASGSTGVSFLVSRQQSAASANRMRQQYESEIALHESYIREGKQFLKSNPYAVSLWDYQGLMVAYMLTCRKHDYMMCVGPEYHLILYYDHNTDVTLGQYLEMCFDLERDCPSVNRRCAHPLYEHRHSYIHNKGKTEVTIDEFPCPVERLSGVMLMWGECKRCGKNTPVTKLSDETWRYSFGKYLETTFYNDTLRPRACICPHDAHQDYVRCFSLRNMVARFTHSSFLLWNIATPTTPLYFNVEVSIRLKDQEAAELRERLDKYYSSLISRLEAFPLDMVFEDKVEECRHVLSQMSVRAATEKVYFQQTLEQTLRNTHPADTLVIVVVYEALQGKVVEWNLRFSELAQTFIQLDATSSNRNAPKRINTNATAGEVGAATDLMSLTRTSTASVPSAAKKDEIDSLEVIDELHSAANHHHHPASIAGAELNANYAARFEMPRLGSSPLDDRLSYLTRESSSENLVNGSSNGSDTRSLVQSSSPQLPLRSRLHRRLSMEMMKRERERQEKFQEKVRRNADNFDNRGNKYVRNLQKGSGLALAQMQGYSGDRSQGQSQQQTQLEPTERQLRHVTSGVAIGRYLTTRLIGGIATDVDDTVRIPQQPEFPELRGRKEKIKLKYTADYNNRRVQPLLDMLRKPSGLGLRSDAGTGITEDQPKENVTVAPSRIPGIRSLQQQQPKQQPQQPNPHASSRPLSSFGRPPNPGNSNIPRPPNIRGRAVSPTADDPQRPISQALLLLAKPLLTATIPLAETHPTCFSVWPSGLTAQKARAAIVSSRRIAGPSTQETTSKPQASVDEASRKPTPPRRHSYQFPPGSQPSVRSTDVSWHVSMHDRDDDLEEEQFISSKTPSTAIPGSSRYDIGEYGDHDRWQPHSLLRHRSATVSQVPSKAGPSRNSAGSSRPDERAQLYEQEPVKHERKASMTSRASSIIPSITRRLGLGFGFRSSQHRSLGGNEGHRESGQTSDGEASSVGDVQGKQRVVSAGNSDNRRSRAPIPPQLAADHNQAQRQTHKLLPRKLSNQATNGSYGGRFVELDVSSDSASISIDSSNESDDYADSGITNQLSYPRDILRTPPGRRNRSNRNSYAHDSADEHFPLAGSLEAQTDLVMSSPMRTLQRSTLANENMASSATDSEDGSRLGVRRFLESSSRYMHPRLHRDSSTEDDEFDNHEPDLHFGQSDASSDEETEAIGAVQDASSAVSYLQSVIAEGNRIPAAQSNNALSHDSSVTSVSAITNTGLLSEKMGLIESGLDTGAGGNSGVSDSTAAATMPQENLNTLWKAISNLLMISGSSQLFQIGLDLVYPLDPTEHVVAGSPVIVRETEPSSIIAFTLMAKEYRTKLHDIFETARNEPEDANMKYEQDAANAANDADQDSDGGELRAKSPANEFDRPSQIVDEDTVIERVLLRSSRHHLPFQFIAGQTKFVCRVYYAPQFEALRRCYGCEDSYTESLSRCMAYDAKGGKSGSAFLHTHDKRFVIKQLLDISDWNADMLVKIFGFCRVSYRSATTGKSVKMNVIIMENLFYERECARVYDLKGSERNRLVDETGTNAVFQDENLIRYIRENPICVSQQTKSYLHDAIWNDTLFLSMMNVMDYSLLIGFDKKNKELVVGIVDFIRTFTWDKKLESWVKEAGILGGGGKGPTIVSPKQYKTRFRKAMERYFLMVPDMFTALRVEDED
ncbi:hypothetical protein BX070DRAFT_235203 [Coemansia spiralis]|nr:hypothetical protein BX070DRAFT_235203 [Coemansia spiralis]